MNQKHRNQLRNLFATPMWHRETARFYGMTFHAGRKHARDLEDEKKARQGQPVAKEGGK